MADVKKLLIYRMGSIGDTVVALPIFHMLVREFADAERRVLTNRPVNSDAAPIQEMAVSSMVIFPIRPALATSAPSKIYGNQFVTGVRISQSISMSPAAIWCSFETSSF